MPVTYDSEDDDTDKLLQIPPDKYLVPSSEESVENFQTKLPIQYSRVEKYKPREEKQEIQVICSYLLQPWEPSNLTLGACPETCQRLE